MTYLEATYHVLAQAGTPLHYAEITRRALAQSLITPTGRTPEATIIGLPTKLREITHSMAHCPLKLYKTYDEQGFFNITVAFDGYVRNEEGPIPLLLGAGVVIEGRIDRHANQNATAHILGGVQLRDWFHQNFACGDVVNVDLSPTEQIRLMK